MGRLVRASASVLLLGALSCGRAPLITDTGQTDTEDTGANESTATSTPIDTTGSVDTTAATMMLSDTLGTADTLADTDDDVGTTLSDTDTTGPAESTSSGGDFGTTLPESTTSSSGDDFGTTLPESTSSSSDDDFGTTLPESTSSSSDDDFGTTLPESTSSSTGAASESTTGGCNDAPGVWADCADGEDCMSAVSECLSTGVAGQSTCTFECETACDCPAPPMTGDPTVTCDDIAGAGGPDGINECFLACDDGEQCPNGQVCFADALCVHTNTPPAVEPYEGCDPPDFPCPDDLICVVDSVPATGSSCLQPCSDVMDCPPAPVGGTLACEVILAGPDAHCYLTCEDGTPCPMGWDCFAALACLQPVPS